MRITSSKIAATFAVVLCAAFAIHLAGTFLQAQTFFGSIVGTVTDPSGAVVVGASVNVTNLATSEKRTMVTDDRGNYQFVNLVPARYRLDVEMDGFKHFTRESVAVTVDAAARIDVALEVGSVSDTISVSAETPLLQTESSSLSQEVEGRNVQEMPLNGRNVMNLISLVPSVVPQGGTSGSPVGNTTTSSGVGEHTSHNGWNNYQVGGGMAGQSATFLDGSPLNMVGYGGNTQALVATQDAIQEFRVVTNNVSAEFGRFGGGVINMTTKSGANEFHGSAYEYLRNRALNANYFFSNATNSSKPPWVQNQYGATLGGPIKKDKTFFYFSWENYSLRTADPALLTVPTAAQRAGDFSSTAIYDPLTTVVSSSGTVSRTKFANNIIPSDRIDPTAKTILSGSNYWPLPNVNLAGGNYYSQAPGGGDMSQYNVRIDQNVSDKQRMFGRFTYWTLDDISFNPTLNGNGNPAGHNKTLNVVFGDTYTLTPTTILDFRASYLRQHFEDRPPSLGTDLSQFGTAWASLNSMVTLQFLPKVTVSGLYGFGSQDNNSNRYWNNSVMSLSLTKIQGRHTFKVGGEVRLMDNSMQQGSGNLSGSFTFTNAFTSSNNTTSSGNAFASFLLGYVSSGTIGVPNKVAQYLWYQGYYFSDTFQVNNRLTLNLGVRWELPGALAERHDRAMVLQTDATDPLSQTLGLSLKGAPALVNSSAYSNRTVQNPKYDLFAPRVGFAYRITDRTVLRSGYGISYLPNGSGRGIWDSALNVGTEYMTTSLDNGQTPYNTLSNPFPAGGVKGTVQQQLVYPTGRSSSYLDTLRGLSITGIEPDQPYPYVQQWNLDIQHEFAGNMMFEVGYAGSKGTHLQMNSINLNQLPDQYDSLGTKLSTKVANPFYGYIASTSSLGKSTTTAGQLLLPFPQFLNYTSQGVQRGNSSYHAMVIKVQKRFGAGGTLMGNYTWSKNIGDTDTLTSTMESTSTGSIQDYTNLAAERSLLSFDVPHRAIVSYVVDLPFGKGKKYLSGATGITSKLVSGWSMNGITTFQSGFPLVLTAQATTLSSSYGAGTPRPNVSAGCVSEFAGKAQDRLAQWFNTACFTQPGSYSFGDESRVDPALRAAGVNNFDFSLAKITNINERFNLRFGAEVFNLFNRVQFQAPGTTLGVSTFGVVSSQANKPRTMQFSLRLNF